jgi:hypothetical protein
MCHKNKCKGIIRPVYGSIKKFDWGYKQIHVCDNCGYSFVEKIKHNIF